jgi:hypothetical protein
LPMFLLYKSAWLSEDDQRRELGPHGAGSERAAAGREDEDVEGVMAENHKHGDLSVYELTGTELRDMVLSHANSLAACYRQVEDALEALPPDADADAPAETRRSAVFRGSMEAMQLAEAEARYLASHVPLDKAFMLNATQLLAFKKRWGVVVVDIDKLAWAPRAATQANEQAERSLASTVTATPRIILPDGSLTRLLGS